MTKDSMPGEISIVDKKEKLLVASDAASLYFDTARFEHAYRVANMLSQSSMVPKHFQGQPSNCLIALNMAGKFNLDPLMVMLKMPIVKDKPTMEGQLVIALVNAQMPFDTKLKFEIVDSDKLEDVKCTCWAMDGGERIEYSLSVKEATAIGQAGTNANWKNKGSAKLMLMYRTATYLVRTHAPEVLLGLYTTDEMQDMGKMIDATPSSAAEIIQELQNEVEIEVIEPEKKPASSPQQKSGSVGSGSTKESGDLKNKQPSSSGNILLDQSSALSTTPAEETILPTQESTPTETPTLSPDQTDMLSETEKAMGITVPTFLNKEEK